MRRPTAVELHALLASPSLEDLTVLHEAKGVSLVAGVRYITDIEEISIANPDTALFITEGVGLGGWMVSAAIRIAWERKSAMLVVPALSLSESVVKLARRLDVTLLATPRTISSIALDFALALGEAQAGTVVRVHSFMANLYRFDSVKDAILSLSQELNGAPIDILNRPSTDSDQCVLVPVSTSGNEEFFLRALVPPEQVAYATEVLTSAAPHLGLLMVMEAHRKQQQAFPLVSIAALLALTPPPALRECPSPWVITDQFGWALTGGYAVCFITAPGSSGEQLLVQQSWEFNFPEEALVQVADGWLALLPIPETVEEYHLREKLQGFLDPLRVVRGVKIGLSTGAVGFEQAYDAVRQAWLASLFANDLEVLPFSELQLEFASRMVPGETTIQLATYFFPALMRSRHRSELVAAGLAYCNAFGSVARAAELTRVHRNTIQSRISKLESLGVPLSDPKRALGTHMLLHAINLHCQEESEKTP